MSIWFTVQCFYRKKWISLEPMTTFFSIWKGILPKIRLCKTSMYTLYQTRHFKNIEVYLWWALFWIMRWVHVHKAFGGGRGVIHRYVHMSWLELLVMYTCPMRHSGTECHLWTPLWPWTLTFAGYGQSLWSAWNQQTGTLTRKYDGKTPIIHSGSYSLVPAYQQGFPKPNKIQVQGHGNSFTCTT